MNSKTIFIVSLIIFLISGSLILFKNQLVQNFLPQPYFSELEDPQRVAQIKNQTGEWQTDFSQPIFLNKPVAQPITLISQIRVLGQTLPVTEKWIEVDLSQQKLYAYEDDKIIYEFLISSGKWAPTPVGEFRIWSKLRYLTMSGGDKANGTYYYLPNVPYVMFFYQAFALHGTYWHNNFGIPMSHGCVNLNVIDAEKLFTWTGPILTGSIATAYPTKDNPGTRVVIHE